MPIFCPNCGVSNPDHSKFCYSCGKPILKQDTPPTTTQEFYQPETTVEVTASNMIESGMEFLKENPKIIWLLIFFAPISIFSTYLFTSQMPNLSSLDDYVPYYTSLPVISFGPYFFEYLIIALVLNLIVSVFFASWILTSYKQITFEEERQNLDLRVSFTKSLEYILSLIAVRLIVTLIIVLIIIAFVFILNFSDFLKPVRSDISINSLLSIGLITVLFIIALLIIVIYIMVLFTYVDQAIVLGEKTTLSSLTNSAKMAKSRFWNTLGIVLAFGFFTSLISGAAENPIILVPITMFLSLLRVFCLAWGYQEYFQLEFKKIIEDER